MLSAMDAFYTYVITAHQYGVDVPRARWNELTDAEKRAWGKVVEEVERRVRA